LCNLLVSERESCEGNAPDLYLGGAPFEFKLHWITFGGFYSVTPGRCQAGHTIRLHLHPSISHNEIFRISRNPSVTKMKTKQRGIW